MIIVSSCSCLCPTHWSQVFSREWRCSWGDASTTSEGSTILLPSKVWLILETWQYIWLLLLFLSGNIVIDATHSVYQIRTSVLIGKHMFHVIKPFLTLNFYAENQFMTAKHRESINNPMFSLRKVICNHKINFLTIKLFVIYTNSFWDCCKFLCYPSKLFRKKMNIWQEFHKVS